MSGMISEQVKGLRKLANQWKHNDVAGCNLIFEAADTIEALSAKGRAADRPTGEWVDAEIPIESGRAMPIQVCNLCNTFYPLAHTGGGYHFCPNCGARMVREDGGA